MIFKPMGDIMEKIILNWKCLVVLHIIHDLYLLSVLPGAELIHNGSCVSDVWNFQHTTYHSSIVLAYRHLLGYWIINA
jgi:hypothetical protein